MMNNRIAIPAFATDEFCSGIGQHCKAMLENLPKVAPEKCRFVIFINSSDSKHLNIAIGEVQIVTVAQLWCHPIANIFWHWFIFPILVRVYQCNRILYLAANRRISWTLAAQSVAVVHDLSQLHVCQKYDALRTFYTLRVLPVLLKRMGHICCVSHATARDVQGWIGIDSKATSVVHNGVNTVLFRQAAEHCTQPTVKPHLIYPARLEHPGKNHINLLRAFAKLKRQYNIPHKLIFAGKDWSGSKAIYQEITHLDLHKEVEVLGFVDEQKLADMVAQAEMMVFPSLFEGFGLPLVEAMAANTLVAASDCSSIPEVVGDDALLFNPHNVDEMSRVIYQGLANDHRRLIHRARRRSEKFNWDIAANQLLAQVLNHAG